MTDQNQAMTRDQWKCAARFAGVYIAWWEGPIPYLRPDDYPSGLPWQPLTDWSDFGPLWVMLFKWSASATAFERERIGTLVDDMQVAIEFGTEQELMQAGCLFAAAIGATMKEVGK